MKFLVIVLFALTAAQAFPRASLLNNKFRKNVRIIGGDEANIEDFPWIVSLEFWGLHNCGGSIIGNDTIVTAGHCIDGLLSLFYKVVAGTSDISKNGTRIDVKESIVHENFTGYDNDIAIIKLAEPLVFSDQIQPVALPEQDEEIETGTPVNISGWGVTSEGGLFTPAQLRSVEVNIVDHDICAEDYAEFADQVPFTENMVCAAVDGGGKDACQGDSGGPLTKDGKLVGIVSWGLGCAEPDYPGVYTNVARYRNWIKEKTGI